MPLLPRPEISDIPPCPHGGPNHAELEQLGLNPEDVIDFSVSANPFGPPPEVKSAIASAVIDRYPDSASLELRRSLSAVLGTPPESIIAGNGSMDLIRVITTTYLERGDPVIIPQPTFGEYEIACRIAGARVITHRLPEEDGFRLSAGALARTIRDHNARLVFLCNPNNPTGQYLGREEIEHILSVCRDCLLVLDEAYVSFADEPWDSLYLTGAGNLLVLRSMTKDYALAGLRLGYAVARPDIIQALEKVCPPWNVNAVAQKAGVAALKDKQYLSQCRTDIRRAREFLFRRLGHLGLHPVPSDAHLFLLKVGDAARFRQELLKHRIMVRDCSSFGLPAYIRIAPRTRPECAKLVQAISEVQQ